MKAIIIIFLVAAGCTVLTAHQEPELAAHLDSVTLDVTPDRQYHYIHHTLPKQTLYSISKLYGIDLDQLYMANPELTERIVREHELIKIPAPNITIDAKASTGTKLFYIVKPKETLFRIARVYFGLSIDELKKLNQLEGEELSVGQILYIGRRSTSAKLTDPVAEAFDTIQSAPTLEYSDESWTEKKSIAYWLKESTDSGNLVVLHNDAPLHSTISITNPMYGKTIQAKVIGKIPPRVYPNDIDIILSRAVADELGAIDARLYVKVKHLR